MIDVDSSGTPRYAFYGLEHIVFHPSLAAVKKQWPALLGIHVGSIPIVSSQSAEQLLELVTTVPAKILVSFDPNIRLAIEPDVGRWRAAVERFRQRAHLIKVSEEDLVNLYGPNVDSDAIAGSWLGERCLLLAVTRGENGVTYYYAWNGTAPRHRPEAKPAAF